MKTRHIPLLLLLFTAQAAIAQTQPVFSQFYANPFQFNPAFISSNGYSEVNVFYRKQWMNISNAPETMALNFQAPVGRSVSIGFTALSDKTVLLTNTSMLATFGYRIRMGSHHNLNFGISAGPGFNRFDFEAIAESNDPALINIVSNNTYLSAQAGINYTLKRLTIGFALPRLFENKVNTTSSFDDVRFSPTDTKFASLAYQIPLRDFTLTPQVLYRSFGTNQDQIEGALIAQYKNIFWIGGSYVSETGINGFIGINLKRLLRIGYSYQHPTSAFKDVAGGSHEVYLGYRVGKNNREEVFEAKQAQKDSVVLAGKEQKPTSLQPEELKPEETKPEEKTAPIVTNEKPRKAMPNLEVIEPETKPAETPNPVITQEKDPQPVLKEKVEEPKTELKKEEPKKTERLRGTFYHIVVGAYKVDENATKQVEKLRSMGISAEQVFDASKGYHYVTLYSSKDKDQAVTRLIKIKMDPRFSEVWILKVNH